MNSTDPRLADPDHGVPTLGRELPTAVPLTPSPLDALRNIATQAAVLSDAQVNIWKIKLLRVVMLVLIALPTALILTVLAIYGFVQLDKSLGIALKLNVAQPWAPPLIRGGLYLGICLIVALIGWSKMTHTATEE